MCTVLWFVAVVAACTVEACYSLQSSTHPYTNTWAVEVKGGKEEADTVAQKYEFINKGPVGKLRTIFEFELPEYVYERENKNIYEPYHQVTELLTGEIAVTSAEQQVLRKVVTYSFTAPTDPDWSDQWFLFNSETGVLKENANTSRDLNVVPAWKQGVTGHNVTVGVIDNGVEHNHTDLSSNYRDDIDINVVTGVPDAFPGLDPPRIGERVGHGTWCAGIIAMRKDNNKCGVGVAYGSTITGIVLTGDVTDIQEAKAIGHKYDIIDIYSNSWGLDDNGKDLQEPLTCTEKMIKQASEEGRDGKGSIYVFASGNGGRKNDSCAANGYVNNIYTIGIGSASSDSRPPDFDEKCSAKMAVVFTHNNYTLPDRKVVNVATTGTYDSCITAFDGTSAATPAASGAIALALEVNPNLTWRDVQYLIVYTSNHDILSGDKKMINAAGLTFSHQFGFGAIDALAMVTNAKNWINVPSQEVNTLVDTNIVTVRKDGNSITIRGQYSGAIISLEHVVVQVTLVFEDNDEKNDSNRGDIQLQLTSPSGTTSTLLPYRNKDTGPGSYTEWPFMSVHFWGENPNGDWSFEGIYKGKYGNILLNNITFIFYGTTEVLPITLCSCKNVRSLDEDACTCPDSSASSLSASIFVLIGIMVGFSFQ